MKSLKSRFRITFKWPVARSPSALPLFRASERLAACTAWRRIRTEHILATFYPSLKYIVGCFGLFLQSKKVNTYFAELAERVEYGNPGTWIKVRRCAYEPPSLPIQFMTDHFASRREIIRARGYEYEPPSEPTFYRFSINSNNSYSTNRNYSYSINNNSYHIYSNNSYSINEVVQARRCDHSWNWLVAIGGLAARTVSMCIYIYIYTYIYIYIYIDVKVALLLHGHNQTNIRHWTLNKHLIIPFGISHINSSCSWGALPLVT